MSKYDGVPLDLIHRAAQIWCEPQHAHKIMDDELAASIVKALLEEREKSAAPDLLEALKHARNQIQHPDQMIDQAISKAEGQ